MGLDKISCAEFLQTLLLPPLSQEGIMHDPVLRHLGPRTLFRVECLDIVVNG